MVELLHYQDGRTLPTDNNDHGSTEILDIATTVESGAHSATRHSREVFMARQTPQIPIPNPPDIQDGEEALSDISPDTAPPNGETDEQKTAREKENKLDRLGAIAPNTIGRSGSGINQIVDMSNNGAWL